ncbi:MAG TPA: ARMT1-like domain-containing protein [bacterium]|nr:ARMT1-like domain-containing protein [bacterium]
MNTVSDCSLCLLKLAHTSAGAVSAPEPLRLKAVRAALGVLASDDFSRIPPAIARDVMARVNQALATADPFAAIKAEHDDKAARLVDEWAPGYLALAADADDRLARAVRAALIGNIMDLATVPDQADPKNVIKHLDTPFAVRHGEEFKQALERAQDVLYLCDNAGEIAFDRVLIQELLERGKRVTASVKAGPALNDATMEDALRVGLDRLTGPSGPLRIITTGQANMGVDRESASAKWREEFAGAGMVIAKGQANLESLHDCGREVFFITLIKCSHVSRFFGVKKGLAMLYRGGVESGLDRPGR